MSYRYFLPILLVIGAAAPVYLRTMPVLFPSPVNKLSLPLAKIVNKGNENVAYSPLSLTTAIALVRDASAGSTLKKLDEFFGPKLDETLQKIQESTNANTTTKLENLNVVLHEKNVQLKDDFKTRVASNYQAITRPFDIAKKAETVKYVNDLVANRTKNLITEIVKDITQDTSIMLLNTVYFDAKWQTPFKPGFEDVFHGTSGDKNVSFMRKTGEIDYVHSTTHKVQAIQIEYQSLHSMIVLLPDADSSLEKLAANLTETNVNDLILSMQRKHVKVLLPKFEIKSEFDAIPVLTDAGLGDIFGTAVDFSKMTPNTNIRISSAVHKTVIKVNEEGTQAAASTVIAFETYSLVYNELVLKFDRPFMILIREKEKNSDLFVGLVKNV